MKTTKLMFMEQNNLLKFCYLNLNVLFLFLQIRKNFNQATSLPQTVKLILWFVMFFESISINNLMFSLNCIFNLIQQNLVFDTTFILKRNKILRLRVIKYSIKKYWVWGSNPRGQSSIGT